MKVTCKNTSHPFGAHEHPPQQSSNTDTEVMKWYRFHTIHFDSQWPNNQSNNYNNKEEEEEEEEVEEEESKL